MKWLTYRFPDAATIRGFFWKLPDGVLVLVALIWTAVLVIGWLPILALLAIGVMADGPL